MKKLCCVVCGQSFPNPRSLGIHMRSHVVVKSEEPMCRYGFRDNPRKSWRLNEKEKDMLCTMCGEGLNSWNSFFKHMKSHSQMSTNDLGVEGNEENKGNHDFEKEENNLQSNESYEEKEDMMPSQSDRNFTAAIFPGRERHKRRRSPESSSEENEKKMGAFCLIMLSRGIHDFGTNDETMRKRSESQVLNDDFGMNELRKIQSFPSGSEFARKLKKLKASSNKNDLNSTVSELGKRISYKCTTCNKSFPSYQALGGHMASHKKIKIPSFSETPATEELSIQNHRSKSAKNYFQCSICGKIFASGQALGGHKRSHLVTTNKEKQNVVLHSL